MKEIIIEPLFRIFVSKKTIAKALTIAKSYFEQDKAQFVTIVITTNSKIRALNLKFRNSNQITDVLAFNHDYPLEDGRIYLGDIIIAFPRLLDQAIKKGINYRDELQLLIIHGFLHLKGYDHFGKRDKQKMWDMQTLLLRKLNIEVKSLALGDD